MHLFFTSPSSAYFLWCLGLLSPPPEHRRHGVQARVKRPQDPKAGSQGCPTQSMSNQEHVQALGAWGEQAGVRAGLRPEMHWCMPEGKQTRKQCVKGWGEPLCTWKPHGHRSKEGAACSPLTSSRRDGRVKLGTLFWSHQSTVLAASSGLCPLGRNPFRFPSPLSGLPFSSRG
jgi:hypothetical protein